MAASAIFISGSSRGLGLNLVKHILSQPKTPEHLFASCRDPSKAEELQSLAKTNPCVKIVTLDVTKDADIQAAVDVVSGVVGENGLNLLINNAGMFAAKHTATKLEHVTRELMQSHFDANATAPLMLTQKFLPLLKKAADRQASLAMSYQRSAVVNISSIMSSIQSMLSISNKGAFKGAYQYCTSKTALNMITALMSSELKEQGILVAAVHPGWVKTDMGGADGHLEASESAQLVWTVITKMAAGSSGLLISYDGSTLPW